MKLLHLITGLSIAGTGMMLYKLLEAMDRSRFETGVVSLMDSDRLGEPIEALGVPIYTLGLRQGVPSPIALWRLNQVMRKVRPDLVQGWMYHGNLAASLAAWKSSERVPVVWNVRHSLYDLRKEKRLTAIVIRAGARFSRSPARIIYNARVIAAQLEAVGYSHLTSYCPSAGPWASISLELELHHGGQDAPRPRT